MSHKPKRPNTGSIHLVEWMNNTPKRMHPVKFRYWEDRALRAERALNSRTKVKVLYFLIAFVLWIGWVVLNEL